MNEVIKKRLNQIPHKPGVYKMINEKSEIIYIGKAKELKKRVSSYFQDKDLPIRTRKMVEQVTNIQWIEVNSELEALFLEMNIVKYLKPKYNVLLKDGKNFCYLKVSLGDRYPRFSIERGIIKDGSKYFGPKSSVSYLENTMKMLQEVYPVVFNNIYRVGGYLKKVDYNGSIDSLPEISESDYIIAVNKVMDFFEGKFEEFEKEIQNRMMEYAKNKQFEAAAKIRDFLFEFKKILEKQIISEPKDTFIDVFGVYSTEENTYISLFQIRNGKIVGNENMYFSGIGSSDELLESLISQYYSQTTDFPKEILFPQEILNTEILEEWFNQNVSKKIKILFPQKGKKNDLIELAQKNAKTFAEIAEENDAKDKEKWKKVVNDLCESIGISSSLKRVECFDISHFGGTNTVASGVVFSNGLPEKNEYRRYNINSVKPGDIDDFQSMYEVIDRRVKKIEQDLMPTGSLVCKFSYEKLTKKSFTEYSKKFDKFFPNNFDFSKKEEGRSLILYGVFEGKKLIGLIHIYRYDDKLIEIDFENSIMEKGVKEDFLIKIHDLFQDKEAWLWAEENQEIDLISFGFKKLKTLKGKLESSEIVPECIVKFCTKQNGILLNIKIEKKNKVSEIPSMIVIDGGKGQLSSVKKAFLDNGWEKKKDSQFS